MKRLFFALCLTVACIASVLAQEITVKSMTARPMDLSARVDGRKDVNDDPCALVKVQLTIDDVTFDGNIVGNVERRVNEYWVYMTAGTKTLYVKHPKLETKEVRFSDYDISALEGRQTYLLTLDATLPAMEAVMSIIDATNNQDSVPMIIVKTDQGLVVQSQADFIAEAQKRSYQIYIEGKFQAGSMMGVGGGLGAYIKNFNVEAYAIVGMSESKEVFYLPSDKSQKAYSYTYKAMQFGGKVGYLFPINDMFRITPQIGAGIASISGSEKQQGSGTNPKATNAYTIPISAAIRAEILFGKNFGISLTPEYAFAVSKSDAFTRISDVCSDVNGFGQGFNARVGIFVCF